MWQCYLEKIENLSFFCSFSKLFYFISCFPIQQQSVSQDLCTSMVKSVEELWPNAFLAIQSAEKYHQHPCIFTATTSELVTSRCLDFILVSQCCQTHQDPFSLPTYYSVTNFDNFKEKGQKQAVLGFVISQLYAPRLCPKFHHTNFLQSS